MVSDGRDATHAKKKGQTKGRTSSAVKSHDPLSPSMAEKSRKGLRSAKVNTVEQITTKMKDEPIESPGDKDTSCLTRESKPSVKMKPSPKKTMEHTGIVDERASDDRTRDKTKVHPKQLHPSNQ